MRKRLRKKQLSIFVYLCVFCIISLSPYPLLAQISQGGRPASLDFPRADDIPEISLTAPAFEQISKEDIENENLGLTRRVGIAIKAEIDVIRDGKKETLPDGTQIWRLMISCQGALALSPYFEDFQLTNGCRMFLYDNTGQHVLGAYTLYNDNPDRLFSTELIPGDRFVVEINADPDMTEIPSCKISEVSYVYRDLPDFIGNRGTSDDCEVNINCPEGDNWQYQKHGVTRIYVKQNSGFFWCTGSLVNNTLQNNEPFLLTADHCGPDATTEDIAQWIFYFNYEAPGCENPVENPVPVSMTGAEKLANTNTSGSDFLLVRLLEDVPLYYEPYFNGWSIENIPSPSGVSIHHPAGDIRKISTYTAPLQSTQWYSTPGTHWLVYWTETETNWGVTEGGSSGSPLFDNTGHIIGTLTGGQAACESNGGGTGPDQPDYYGKFSYSWDQNGTEPAQQLKYWLDPINSGVTTLTGKYADLTAAFQASQTLILTGSTIEFTNLSSGLPILWEWTFEGGIPGYYQGSQPIEVTYPEAGQYDVKLIVSDGFDYDTLFLKDYIQVVGKVYPNPTSDVVNIFLDEELPANVSIEVFNILGQTIYQEQIPEQSFPLLSVDLSSFSSGVYTIRVQIKQQYLFARVLVKH